MTNDNQTFFKIYVGQRQGEGFAYAKTGAIKRKQKSPESGGLKRAARSFQQIRRRKELAQLLFGIDMGRWGLWTFGDCFWKG
jgi:hypothetical protein